MRANIDLTLISQQAYTAVPADSVLACHLDQTGCSRNSFNSISMSAAVANLVHTNTFVRDGHAVRHHGYVTHLPGPVGTAHTFQLIGHLDA